MPKISNKKEKGIEKYQILEAKIVFTLMPDSEKGLNNETPEKFESCLE